MCSVLRDCREGAGPQPEAVVAKGDANITRSISWKGSIPWHRREHLVVGETRPGRGETGVWVTQVPPSPAPARAVLLLQLLGKAVVSTTSGCFPRRSRGGECHDYSSNINGLSSTPKLIRGDPNAQALPDKCKICMMHGLCIFLHLHFFLPEDLCFVFLPAENSNLCHGWLHCTLPFPS